LFFEEVEVDASIWAFLVMGTSIAVDYTRSRILIRAAKKYNSQALEADALHFSTDIWSSSVVIAGLIGVVLSKLVPALAFLGKADAIAAVGVAIIVIFVSLQLGKRTIMGLLDTAPEGLPDQIKRAVDAIPGVTNCHRVRVRASGPQVFVDVHVFLAGDQSLRSAHDIMLKVEDTVKRVSPGADVIVHPDPYPLKLEEPESSS
jgi:cation diffusion facilitator family transporter